MENGIDSGPGIEQLPNPDYADQEILEMRPDQLADYLDLLDQEGQLEDFLNTALDHPELVAQLSYWEKWFEKSQRKLLDQIIDGKRNIYANSEDEIVDHESLPLELDKRFDQEDLKLIFSNLAAIQLTFGCSKGCPFCGFDAVPGVQENILYFQLENMFRKYGLEIAMCLPMLYWASEPSDYEDQLGLEDKTYQDVVQLAQRFSGYAPQTVTKNTEDNDWLEFIGSTTTTFGGKNRVSVFGMEPDKVADLNERLAGTNVEAFGYHSGESFDHIEGMGVSSKDRDFDSMLPQSGIACQDGVLVTPRGLYNMIVVPVSREHPQGTIIRPLEVINDEEIEVGENVGKYLSNMVVTDRYFHAGLYKPKEGVNLYVGEFPRDVILNTKNSRYFVQIDGDGTVLSVESDFNNLKVVHGIKEVLERGGNAVFVDEGLDQEDIIRKLRDGGLNRFLPTGKPNRKKFNMMAADKETVITIDIFQFKGNDSWSGFIGYKKRNPGQSIM